NFRCAGGAGKGISAARRGRRIRRNRGARNRRAHRGRCPFGCALAQALHPASVSLAATFRRRMERRLRLLRHRGLPGRIARLPEQAGSPFQRSIMAALAGIRVIELAHIMSGPTAGMLLADMGADVIKVEKVPGGDDTRRFTPPEVNGEASAFMMMNRNKRGIALDLKQAPARLALRRLIDRADVVIENFRVGTLERLDLGYGVLCSTNPALIYCAISGYGRTGAD